MRAVEHFRKLLLGKEFYMQTDHAAHCNFFRCDLVPTSRLECWILRLSEYNFKIENQQDHDNVITDVLSRLRLADAEHCKKLIFLD